MDNLDAMLNEIDFEEDTNEIDELFAEIGTDDKKETEELKLDDSLFAEPPAPVMQEEPKAPVQTAPVVEPKETIVQEAPKEIATEIEQLITPKHAVKEELVIKDRPVIKDAPKKTTGTALEAYEGKEDVVKKFTAVDPVRASMNIFRKDENGAVMIAMGPSKVIECSEEEGRILVLDHILKTQNITDDDRRTIYEYELTHKADVKKVFGTDDVAKLNGFTQEEFDAFMTRIPAEVQAILDKLSAELGMKFEPTPELANAKSETEILKILLKNM